MKLSPSAIQNLQIETDHGPTIRLYQKDRWNISQFWDPDDAKDASPLPHPSEHDPLNSSQDPNSEGSLPVALDQDIEAAWENNFTGSPPPSDCETETESDTGSDSDDRTKDPDYTNSSNSADSADSDASDCSGHVSTTALPKQTKTNVSSERQYARFLNALVSALQSHVANPQSSYPIIQGFRTFTAAFSTVPIFHALAQRKPDLIVIESKQERLLDDISWEDPKIIMELTEEEYTPTSRIAYTLHTKAYLVLRSQPWRRFVLGFSIARSFMRIHYYDRSGAIISRPVDIHDDPRKVIDSIAAAAFADRSLIGFDPTIEISPPRLADKSEPPPARAASPEAECPAPSDQPSTRWEHNFTSTCYV